MKKILFPILMILAVVGGAVAADFIRSSGGSKAEASSEKHEKTSHKKDSKDSHAKTDKKSKKKKDDGHGKSSDKGHSSSSDSGNVAYLKFKRQFVVPVMQNGKIDALVIMNLNLELNDDVPDNAYSLEPKLRDALTRELLTLSDDDMFGTNLTSADSYEVLRSTLLRAAKAVMPEGIEDILILDIARQEQ